MNDALPFLCAAQPALPEFMTTIAEPVTREDVLEEIRGGFVTAIASDIRAEIIGDNLGISVPTATSVQHIESGSILLIGVFLQEIPELPWDGKHRGAVEWYRVVAQELMHYEPPM